MTKAFDLDLKKLKARAFDRAEWAGEALQRYHSAIQKLDDVVVQQLRALYLWMFVPTTLWPFNVQDVLEDCLAALEKGKRLNRRRALPSGSWAGRSSAFQIPCQSNQTPGYAGEDL